MTKHIIWLALLLALPMSTRAELRTIALDIHRAEDKTVKVSIYSDVKKEQQKHIAIAKAIDVLKEAKGWGSSVEVAVITDGDVDLLDYLPLLQAVARNAWLDLAVLKSRTGVGDRILKHYNIEQ